MDWLLPVGTILLGVLVGGVVTYCINVRFSREQDKKARNARLRGLEQEIEANLLLVDAPNLTGQGGKPRLLANALQKSQDDWFSLEITLQKNLQKLYSEISIYNDRVDFFVRQVVARSDVSAGKFFESKSPEIKELLKVCQADFQNIISHDPKK